MQSYYIEFVGQRCGILISAKSWKDAKEVAENPKNWRDEQSRVVSYIALVHNDAPDFTCYKI